jgi:hypothetical protein
MTTHGQSRTRLYTTWSKMKGRCLNSNDQRFDYYGGRGIKVCRSWMRSFEAFRQWAMAHGYESHLTIDRFPNKNGDYEPSNCRWATYAEQNRNRRDNNPITHNGEVVLISVLAERHDMPADVVKNRIRRYGWTVEESLAMPVREKKKHEPWIADGMSRSSWYRHGHNIGWVAAP